MFRQFAKDEASAYKLFMLHPYQVSYLLEQAWQCNHVKNDFGKGILEIGPKLGQPLNRSNLKGFPEIKVQNSFPYQMITTHTKNGTELGKHHVVCPIFWDHLIYAYMVENTRVYEIFRRVINEFIHGEKLGIPTEKVQRWVRITEEVFYRDPPPFSITTLNSYIRPNLSGSRRNAYQRMFGMDLNHGTDDNKPYPYIKADVANNEFVSTFEEFLREVWVGITNYKNTSGANPTDDGKITNLVETLFNMLTSRREYGNLSREEFAYVSMMSWFHLSLEFDSPIVQDLRAESASPEQRLFKIAQRVGIPAHGLSRSYFEIADPISRLLVLIETGILNTEAAVPALYYPGTLKDTMNSIITHWSIITGRDMKARKVAAT